MTSLPAGMTEASPDQEEEKAGRLEERGLRLEKALNLPEVVMDGDERTIDTHIKNLRKKIATIIPDRQLVSTVYGLGYKLIEAEEERRT